ncbi:MAG: methylated-DNA--[protein]-cysteine S-methyltransferase [Alphaproteobacteria bacterium]|nr:methylated-DNA--[protein]-cysteine S-methyltransferase [Alphaproteobacteria bacterium]
MPHAVYDSPVGPLTVVEEDGVITELRFEDRPDVSTTPLLAAACEQLYGYFYCGLRAFELPLRPAGTEFQQAIWDAMLRIPPGQVRTYGELAAAVGSPGAARAVGGACGKNPIPVLIPCHRVIAGDHLGGYSGAGGLATKSALLQLEGYLLCA